MLRRRPLLLALPAWRLASAADAGSVTGRDGEGREGRAGLTATPTMQPEAASAGRDRRPLSPRPLSFPRDHGAHPETRTEWWYVTGRVQSTGTPTDSPAREFGFQLTFFRSRVDEALPLRSRFAAQQLIVAHAALTDLGSGRLLHDQRIARQGFGLAEAATEDTHVRLRREGRDWSLVRNADGTYRAELSADSFGLSFTLRPTQPLLLQGTQGWSRKGPDVQQASFYVSEPQLAVSGTLQRGNERLPVQGCAWLDHEWSESLLHPQAVGWDWIGINLDDGSALTAFRLRRADGSALWAGGSWRTAGGRVRAFASDEVRFAPVRTWASPATGAVYPVEWQVDTPAGRHTVRARLDAQELDSRMSTGNVYWEGLSHLLDAQGRVIGHGYLEMTGYATRLRL